MGTTELPSNGLEIKPISKGNFSEIVFVASIECGLEIVKVVDDKKIDKVWLKKEICPIESLKNNNELFDMVIISDFERYRVLAEKLHETDVPFEKMVVCTGQKVRPLTTVQLVD